MDKEGNHAALVDDGEQGYEGFDRKPNGVASLPKNGRG
jgi:hypothetical protein